jgi:hypothetical protein
MADTVFLDMAHVLRRMLDAFVNSRMREIAAAAVHPIPSVSAVAAMQLIYPDLSERPTPKGSATAMAEGCQPAGLTPDHPLTAAAPFQPLDPEIVNAAIPAFFIGRNKEGFWLARDVKGGVGGIFLFEGSALSFARRNSWPLGCATIFPSERFELDVENQGNPLIVYLRPLHRLAMQVWLRIAALTGKIAEAISRAMT